MPPTMIKKSTFAFLTLAATTFVAHAAAPAFDNAAQPAYADGWEAGDNGGSGFGAWTFVGQGFIGTSTANGNSMGGIDSSGVSFGLFSNAGAPANAQAIRPFSSSLAVGETFMMDFDNGFVATGGIVGFALRNAANNSLFQFTFTGGENFYRIEGSTSQTTAHGFTSDGMRTSFTLTSESTFSFSVQFNDNMALEVFTGTLANPGGAITNLRLLAFNTTDPNGSLSDVFYNNLQVIPEPSSIALLAAPMLLGGWFFARRRRG